MVHWPGTVQRSSSWRWPLLSVDTTNRLQQLPRLGSFARCDAASPLSLSMGVGWEGCPSIIGLLHHWWWWWWWRWWWWLLLYSAILRSRADSLRLHVILHEWISFYSAFLNIHLSGVITVLAWLVPHETVAVSARSVYTIQPCTMSLRAKPHT